MGDDDDAAALEIAWLEIADPPELWEDLGYTVDGEGRCVIGSVEHRLVGPPADGEPGGIVRWAVFGPDPEVVGPDGIDGLPTLLLADPYRPDEAPEHPNGVFRIDHLVIATSDTPRTAAELTAVGLGRRGGRTTNSAGDEVDMTFFWAGQGGGPGDSVLLELSGPPTPSPRPRPARFRGIAYACHDLDATVALLAGRTTTPRDAVQPGRRIAALTGAAGSSLPMAFMTPHVRNP